MHKISSIAHQSYQVESLVSTVQAHFDRFSLSDKLSKDSHVLIKPNLLMKRSPEEFTTTHPALVEAAVICLKQMGVTNITVADSPGGLYNESALKGIYQATGMAALCARQQVALNQDFSHFEKECQDNQLVKRFTLIAPVKQADFTLNICKLKTHAMTGLSGAVKNLFGTVPGLMKPEFHWRFPDEQQFCQMLVDLCQTVSPDFVLVDAIEAMEGNGPSGGEKRHLGLTLAADNHHAMDYHLCNVIGVDPDSIHTVVAAKNQQLFDSSAVVVEGDSIAVDPFQKPHGKHIDFTGKLPAPLQPPTKWLTKRLLTSRPKVRLHDCIGCGKCAESCPPKIIEMKDRKAIIPHKNCIHCFCCHEMCPVKAIDLKRSVLFR